MGLTIRQAQASPLPQPYVFSPSFSWDGNDGNWCSYGLKVGERPQSIRVLPGTSTPATITIDAPAACPEGIPLPAGAQSCQQSRGLTFDPDNSITWTPNSNYTISWENDHGLNTVAHYGYDTVALGFGGNTGPSQDHQVIADVADPKIWLGLLPLNPNPTNFTNFNEPQSSLMTSLKNTNTIPSLSWSYSAGAYYRSLSSYGSLILGGYDASITGNSSINIPLNGDPHYDLLAGVRNIRSNSTDINLLPSGAIDVLIDSTIPFFYLPLDACQAFEKAFNLDYNDDFEMYLVTDRRHDLLLQSNPSITFTMAPSSSPGGQTVDITLPYAAFDLTASYPYVNSTLAPHTNSSRYFPLKRATNQTQYAFGRTFLQEAFLTVDYERRNFTLGQRYWGATGSDPRLTSSNAPQVESIYSPGTGPGATSATSNNKKSGLSGGAIAGIVIGVLAVIAIILLAALFFLRRKRRAQKAAKQKEEAQLNQEQQQQQMSQNNYPGPPPEDSQPLSPDDPRSMAYKYRDASEVPGSTPVRSPGSGAGGLFGDASESGGREKYELDQRGERYETEGQEIREIGGREIAKVLKGGEDGSLRSEKVGVESAEGRKEGDEVFELPGSEAPEGETREGRRDVLQESVKK